MKRIKPMGGTIPICPFCHRLCGSGGVKDHIKAKHPDKYIQWINDGQLPYWRYDADGRVKRPS